MVVRFLKGFGKDKDADKQTQTGAGVDASNNASPATTNAASPEAPTQSQRIHTAEKFEMIKFVTDANTGDFICLDKSKVLRIVKSGGDSYVDYLALSADVKPKRQAFSSFTILETGVDYS